jgi:hypothetical protein
VAAGAAWGGVGGGGAPADGGTVEPSPPGGGVEVGAAPGSCAKARPETRSAAEKTRSAFRIGAYLAQAGRALAAWKPESMTSARAFSRVTR